MYFLHWEAKVRMHCSLVYIISCTATESTKALHYSVKNVSMFVKNQLP